MPKRQRVQAAQELGEGKRVFQEEDGIMRGQVLEPVTHLQHFSLGSKNI